MEEENPRREKKKIKKAFGRAVSRRSEVGLAVIESGTRPSNAGPPPRGRKIHPFFSRSIPGRPPPSFSPSAFHLPRASPLLSYAPDTRRTLSAHACTLAFASLPLPAEVAPPFPAEHPQPDHACGLTSFLPPFLLLLPARRICYSPFLPSLHFPPGFLYFFFSTVNPFDSQEKASRMRFNCIGFRRKDWILFVREFRVVLYFIFYFFFLSKERIIHFFDLSFHFRSQSFFQRDVIE